MPQVSVIVIARDESDTADIKLHLSRQRFRDFELIVETGDSIPRAWNRALRRARGTYIVFTETDVRPLGEFWLHQLVEQMGGDEKLVVKGLEVVGTPWNLSNVILSRAAIERIAFDESFRWAEDTEFFSRLQAEGYVLERREVAPVFHAFDPVSRKALGRAFRYGVNWVRIRNRYRQPIERARLRRLLLQWAIVGLQALGMAYGTLRYFSDRKSQASSETPVSPATRPLAGSAR